MASKIYVKQELWREGERAMQIFIILGVLFFIAIGTPIGISLGVISMIYMLIRDIPLGIAVQQSLQGSNNFVLAAIPFFLLTGELMREGQISNRLVSFANQLVGHIKGGLGHVNVVVSMLFAGISGSALADTSAIGSVLIPEMVEKGYDRDFSVAVTGASSVVGPIIPPSMPMIIAAYLSRQSVGKMFMGGAIPGLLLGLGMMVIVYIHSKQKDYPVNKCFQLQQLLTTFLGAFLPLMTPVLILGGIMFGVFTATQAGAVASLYSFVLGFFVYRQLGAKKLFDTLVSTVLKTGSVMFVVALANVYTWVVTRERIPMFIYQSITNLTEEPLLLLILISLSLLIIGCFLSTTPAIILSIPVLVPVVANLGFDPLYFAVLASIVLCVGTITPPVGLSLYLVCSIGKIEVEKVLKQLFPFYIVFIAIILLLIFFPSLIMWLPNMM